MIKLRDFLLITLLACGLAPTVEAGPVAGKKAKPAQVRKARVVKKATLTLHDQFLALKRGYRLGEVGRRQAWEQFAKLHERGSQMTKADRVSLLQTQATMLVEAGYPILAAIYASQAVKIAPNPLASDV